MQQIRNTAVHLDEEMLLQMQRLTTGRTDEALNARFGISYNTWRKLLAGQPIRPSLADRLKLRIAALQASDRE
ncbi:hypothetical protein [Sphingobium sp. TCM1]|uniref:hypothetical protein n=1 Tax=Sphingobium sp. TCM1 TaxID=453246 RepID=UPI0007F413CF|nr:hypothetical protein [Sphingobium sp. TCM1]OAN56522.1 hypothetical protein A7Q26_18185 [Sphingobium sp. TCM1]